MKRNKKVVVALIELDDDFIDMIENLDEDEALDLLVEYIDSILGDEEDGLEN